MRLLNSYLHVDLVTAEDNGDVLAHPLKIAMPVRHVLVCDTGCDVKHNDTALALDVVSVAETTKLLLSGGIPYVEADGAEVGRERQRVHLDTESR